MCGTMEAFTSPFTFAALVAQSAVILGLIVLLGLRSRGGRTVRRLVGNTLLGVFVGGIWLTCLGGVALFFGGFPQIFLDDREFTDLTYEEYLSSVGSLDFDPKGVSHICYRCYQTRDSYS